MSEQIFRNVPHERIPDYWKLGWHLVIPSTLTRHDYWSCMMVWLCSCKLIEPKF